MTPNEPLSNETADRTAHLTGVRAASTIVLLAGLWFFVSPWVYGAYTHTNALNSWIVGAVIFILGCIRVANPSSWTAVSWYNLVLGIWAFVSPWVYGYTTNTGRLINSLCVGVIVLVFSIISGRISTRAHAVPMSRV